MQSGLGSKGDNGGGRTHNVTQMNGHTQERERTHSVTKRTDTQGGCTQNVTQRTDTTLIFDTQNKQTDKVIY